jgi:hypothetical protein
MKDLDPSEDPFSSLENALERRNEIDTEEGYIDSI